MRKKNEPEKNGIFYIEKQVEDLIKAV